LTVDIEAVLDRLMEASVSVWLDADGKLRIAKGAPEDVKALVREHKQELMDVRRAQAVMNRPGMRCIRLPLGHLAVAYPLGADLDEIRWAMKVLRMDPMPLVINDEGLRWMTWDEWKLHRRVWDGSKDEQERESARPEPQKPPKLQFGRKTA
jgi:hypothetical protein